MPGLPFKWKKDKRYTHLDKHLNQLCARSLSDSRLWAGFFLWGFDQALQRVVHFWMLFITQNHHCAATSGITCLLFTHWKNKCVCFLTFWSRPDHIKLTSRNFHDLMDTLTPLVFGIFSEAYCPCCCDSAAGVYVLYVCILNYVVLTGLPSAPAGPGWPGLPVFPCSP